MRRAHATALLLLLASGGCPESRERAGDDAGSGLDASDREDAGSPSDIGEPCEPESVPPGGFIAAEAYLETESPSCEEVCMVYQLEGDPRSDCTDACSDPAEAAERVFCTCRCDGPAGEEPFCSCPAGFRCDDVLDSAFAGPGIRGSYCVRDSL